MSESFTSRSAPSTVTVKAKSPRVSLVRSASSPFKTITGYSLFSTVRVVAVVSVCSAAATC